MVFYSQCYFSDDLFRLDNYGYFFNNKDTTSNQQNMSYSVKDLMEKSFTASPNHAINSALFKTPVQTPIPVQSPSTSSNNNTPLTNVNTTPQDVKKEE